MMQTNPATPSPDALQSAAIAEFDAESLSLYLGSRLEGTWQSLKLERFVGGQSNPTYRLQAGDRTYVLRKKPAGNLLPSAHAIDRECRVMTALDAMGFPAPRPILYEPDSSIIGTAFYIMPFVDGRVFKDPALPGVSAQERTKIYDAMVSAIATLHNIDPDKASLGDFSRPGAFYVRQIKRWTEQYRAVALGDDPAMERLIEWLPAHLPSSEERRLVHGDFRLENMLFHPTEPTLLAVIDWELAALGDPMADLAYNMMAWHLPQKAFGGFTDRNIAGSGIPLEADYLARYRQLRDREDGGDWGFYVAFAMFRLAAILYGVLRRGLDGNASSPDAVERGRLAVVCAEAGCRGIELSERNGLSQ
jgi:aminoglycoside phosphotransferase (APT) family kinase protein